MSGVCQTSLLAKCSPKAVAFSGRSSPRSHWPTSIQWTIRSVSMPPPKSQNHRQFRNRYSSNGWSGADPRKSRQATWPGSTRCGPRAKRSPVFRFQLRAILKTLPIRPGLDQLAGL